MSKRSGLLSRVYIASPCSASWTQMEGNDQVRHCQQCKLNVYNISEMSSAAAEKLIIQKEGKLCIRMYQRADGSIITQDCPVALRWLKHKLKLACLLASCLLSWLISFCRGDAQDLPIKLKELPGNLLNYPAANGTLGATVVWPFIYLTDDASPLTIVTMGAGASLPPPKQVKKQLPRITPFTENGVMVSPYWPLQLVLREKQPPDPIPNSGNILPREALIKLAKQPLSNSSLWTPHHAVPLITMPSQDHYSDNYSPTAAEPEDQCIDQSTDLFVLLRKKKKH